MDIDYSTINSSKLADILKAAERARAELAKDRPQQALAVQRLIRSRIAANAENQRCNREYREALAEIEDLRAKLDKAVEALEQIKKRACELKNGTDDWFELTEFNFVAGETLARIKGE
jgi:chromosome segregation ATPase